MPLLSTKPSSFACVVRFVTNRPVCMLTILVVCTLSVLLSVMQFEFGKRELYLRAPIIFESYDIVRNSDEEIQADRTHLLRGVLFNRQDMKLTNLSSSTLTNNFKSVNNSKAIKNQNVDEEQQEQLQQTSVNDVNRSVEDHYYENMSNNHQRQPLNSSLELAFSLAAENTSDDDRNSESENCTDLEDEGYFVENDPAREKLVANVEKFLHRKRMHLYYQQKVQLLPEQTKGIIILTNYRSGSTFLGELFNQHPDAFYVFEPLFPFTGGCDHDQPSLKTSFLQEILKCNFPPMTDVYRKIKGPMRKNNVDMTCLLQDFCFRKNTKELCEYELCPTAGKIRSCRACGPVNLLKVKNVCRRKKMSVVKVIRLCDILQLKPILTDPKLDVKIIHLVRDPRGIESSRMKIHSKWDLEENANNLCSRLLHNGKSALSNSSDIAWLKGRYMKVRSVAKRFRKSERKGKNQTIRLCKCNVKQARYENLSLEPEKFASKIYKFVGLDFVPGVKSWIKFNTRSHSSKSPYSTKRDSAKAMQAWRSHLNLSQVLTIQRICSTTMNFFGYKTVSNQNELNDLGSYLIT